MHPIDYSQPLTKLGEAHARISDFRHRAKANGQQVTVRIATTALSRVETYIRAITIIVSTNDEYQRHTDKTIKQAKFQEAIRAAGFTDRPPQTIVQGVYRLELSADAWREIGVLTRTRPKKARKPAPAPSTASIDDGAATGGGK